MQRTPGLILFCLLTHAATVNELLRCPKRRVGPAVGEDVTLECHVDPERDVTAGLFKLMFNQSKRVLVYKGDGENSSDDQAEQFKDRVSLESNSENLSKGQFVVKISSFTTADAGTYTCIVGKGTRPFHCIELVIKPEENSIKGNQIDGGGDHNNTYVTGFGFGIIIVGGIGIVVVTGFGIIIGIGIGSGSGFAVMKCRRRKCKSMFCLRKITRHHNGEREPNRTPDETDSFVSADSNV